MHPGRIDGAATPPQNLERSPAVLQTPTDLENTHNANAHHVQLLHSSSPPFLDLRLRERRFDPRLFALRLAERFAFLLPPFFADAFLREERLFGAMALLTQRTHGCGTTASSI